MTPTMALPGLAAFHHSMLSCGVRRAHFTVRSKRRAIGVDFYSDFAPFELVFSYKLFRPVLLPVKPGYRVPTMLGDQYGPMKDLLGIEAGQGGHWKPSEFLSGFDAAIPGHYIADTHECRPEHAARHPHLEVEDAAKTMYWYHRDWVQEGVTGDRLASLPTQKNLEKTQRLLGDDMAEFCRRRHISICWTASKSEESAHHVSDIEKRIGLQRSANTA